MQRIKRSVEEPLILWGEKNLPISSTKRKKKESHIGVIYFFKKSIIPVFRYLFDILKV